MGKLAVFAGVTISCSLAAFAQNPASSSAPETATITRPCTKPTFPGRDWKRAPDATDEWSLTKLAVARQYADSLHDSSVVIVQCGRLVYEWGDPTRRSLLFQFARA